MKITKAHIIRTITRAVKLHRNWVNEFKRRYNITDEEVVKDWLKFDEEKSK